MQNIDILILTSVVTTLFGVFGLTVWRELRAADEDSHKSQRDGGPRAAMINFIGSLVEDSSLSSAEKEIILGSVNRTIADMEFDGTYFPESVKLELERRRQELYCEYSDLPAPTAYQD